MSRVGATPESVLALRAQIDAVDDAIADAVARRRALVDALRARKEERGLAFVDPSREAVIEARYRVRLPDLAPERVGALVRAVLEGSR